MLDRYEGLGKGYERKQILLQQDSRSFSAFLYYATAIDARLQPFNWYKQHVIAGAEEAGLPSAYINYLCSISLSATLMFGEQLSSWRFIRQISCLILALFQGDSWCCLCIN